MSGSAKYYNWLSNMTYRHSYAQSVHVHPNLVLNISPFGPPTQLINTCYLLS